MEISEIEKIDATFVENYLQMLRVCIEYMPLSGTTKYIVERSTDIMSGDINTMTVNEIINNKKSYLLTILFPALENEYLNALKSIEVAEGYLTMLNECISYYRDNPPLPVKMNDIIRATINATHQNNINEISVKQLITPYDWNLLKIVWEPRLKFEYNIMRSRKVNPNYITRPVQPSEKYPPNYTYDFGSVRCPNTEFEMNFKRGDPDKTMLLYIYTHGAIQLNEKREETRMNGIKLNKYNISGTGQCAIASVPSARYMVYALSDAVKNNTPLDVQTMLRESLAQSPDIIDPVEKYKNTLTMKEEQTEFGIKTQDECPQVKYDRNNPLGERTSYGNRYVEKIYTLDPNQSMKHGIFICKDWDEIGAGVMDNLLENNEFNIFILKKYGKMPERDGRNSTRSRGRSRSRNREFANLKSYTSLITTNEIIVVDGILLSDILEFCKIYYRHISIVDNSCSVFKDKHELTQRQVDMFFDKFRKLGDGVAYGIRKTKRKYKRISKRQLKPKYTRRY